MRYGFESRPSTNNKEMAETINNRVCVTVQELDGILSYAALASLQRRDQVQCAQRGCRNTSAMYYVDSLPYKYRCEVYKRYPDLNAQAAAKPFIEALEPDGNAINFYDDFTFEDGTHLTPEKVEEYANNAAILNGFRSWLEGSNSERKKTSHGRCPKGEFWKSAAAALERMADTYPNSLPLNPRRLQDKYNSYIKDGYQALISGKHKNSNAAKVDSEEKKAVISALCAIPNGFDNEFVARYYNETAEKMGWEKITAGTVAKYRKENGLVIDAVRYGNTSFSNNRAMQVSRSKPTAAMLMWSLDGWDAELYFQKRNAKGVVTYTNRKVLEVVVDPCCDFPIGYAIGDVENAELIAEALRNAANYTRELFGQRYRTCQIQSDHYAMKAMAPYYATVSDKVTPARVKNAKSKPVERYFDHLNETYCKTQSNWSGYGITADKKHQPSSEFHNIIKRNFPDEEGVIRQLEAMIAAERQLKMEEYRKFWDATPEERRLPLPEETFLLRFGKTTGYTNVLEGSGLRPRLEGKKRQYDCFDVRFREYAYLRWEVRYDADDMSHVLAVSEDGRHRFLLEEKYVQPMALADRKEGDAEQLQRVANYNNALKQHTQTLFGEITAHAKPILGGGYVEQLESPDAHNDLAKALITDSKGQHKSQRASERRRILQAVDVEYSEERKPEPVPVVVENTPAGESRVNTFDLY